MKKRNYINRQIEPTLKSCLEQSKCVLITGARQVGKSTLIKKQFPDYKLITFDDQNYFIQGNEDPSLFFVNNPGRLFLDEVQRAPKILNSLKIVLDNSEERGNYILSGSQGLALIKGMSESLAGRVMILRLSGLSLREIFQSDFNMPFIPTKDYIEKRENSLSNYSSIWEIIHRGSFPELYQIERNWEHFYQSYTSTYLQRDINELINADALTFSKFLTAVAARTGQVLNYSNIANDVGVSLPTIKNWISILEQTGIISLLLPYFSSSLKRVIKSPKLYFRDTGLACYLTNWLTPEALKNSAVAGAMFETFVINEIQKSYSNCGFDYRNRMFYYRGRDRYGLKDNEIDLVIEQNGLLHPVEIKLTATPKAEMASTNQVLDSIPEKKRGLGAIVCLIDRKLFLRENLVALPFNYI